MRKEILTRLKKHGPLEVGTQISTRTANMLFRLGLAEKVYLGLPDTAKYPYARITKAGLEYVTENED